MPRRQARDPFTELHLEEGLEAVEDAPIRAGTGQVHALHLAHPEEQDHEGPLDEHNGQESDEENPRVVLPQVQGILRQLEPAADRQAEEQAAGCGLHRQGGDLLQESQDWLQREDPGDPVPVNMDIDSPHNPGQDIGHVTFSDLTRKTKKELIKVIDC